MSRTKGSEKKECRALEVRSLADPAARAEAARPAETAWVAWQKLQERLSKQEELKKPSDRQELKQKMDQEWLERLKKTDPLWFHHGTVVSLREFLLFVLVVVLVAAASILLGVHF